MLTEGQKQELLDSIIDQMYTDQVGELRVCYNLPSKNICLKKQVREPSFQKEIHLT